MNSDREPILLTRHDHARNMARFYRIALAEDLFGGVQLVRNWGRIGTGGRVAREWFARREEAETSRLDWLRRKRRKGYREG